MASIVASIRGSRASMNPTIGIISTDASRSSRTERLGERLRVVAPALGQDGVGDLVARRALQRGDAVRRVEHLGQRDGPVERHPAHQLRVEEVLRTAPHLPDALVRLAASARRRRRPGWRGSAACRRSPRSISVGQPGGRVEQLAVDVELALVPRTVADPHGTAVPPSGEMRQLALGQVVLAADAEHDLQVAASLDLRRRRGGHEVEERVAPRPGRRPPTALRG